jgi:hypothetical protein
MRVVSEVPTKLIILSIITSITKTVFADLFNIIYNDNRYNGLKLFFFF